MFQCVLRGHIIYWQHSDVTVFLCALQICDKEWHYYVINVEFPAVTLFVDGVTYEPYLVTDDWPIHASKIDTQLTVGACWQGQCVCVFTIHKHRKTAIFNALFKSTRVN